MPPVHAPCAWHFTLCRSSFSRSYGGILPSSLTRVFPRTLGFSPRPPVSVYGTGSMSLPRSFSRQYRVNQFAAIAAPHHASAIEKTDLPIFSPTRLYTNFQSRADLPSCVTPSIKQFILVQEYQPVVHRLRFSASA